MITERVNNMQFLQLRDFFLVYIELKNIQKPRIFDENSNYI